jgi:hypothetical protein
VVDSQITSGWGNFHLEIEDTLIHDEVNFVFPAPKQAIRFQTPWLLADMLRRIAAFPSPAG